jgi:quercetin dioxygenase-like cupin family protein
MTMKVIKVNTVPKVPRTAPLFTGPVSMQNFVGPDLSKRFMITEVHFENSVRNKFHKHTIEQVLIVTAGKGIVATEQEEIEVTPGDIVFIPAEEIHWHGAAQGSAFSHLYVMSPDSKTTQTEA